MYVFPVNPFMTVTDTTGIAALAKKHGVYSIVDILFLQVLFVDHY